MILSCTCAVPTASLARDVHSATCGRSRLGVDDYPPLSPEEAFDAAQVPCDWRPEKLLDEEGMIREQAVIWLVNESGDMLRLNESDTAALLNAALWIVSAGNEDEGGEWDLSHAELRKVVEDMGLGS